MTSEVDDLKTNEFLRRRKLRLQQVREQSKDIAKQIRQRAKVENLRQVIELDSKKQKEYIQRQAQLVKKLEEYYAEGIENVGVSHKNASEVQLQEAQHNKVDPSKQRGKEAAAELRKKRQQILDKQKKILDRKLQAREIANEISRDKSAAVINKFQLKPVSEEVQSKATTVNPDKNCNTDHGAEKDKDVARNDMATQWDLEEMPNEWEPNIPTLLLPRDDNSGKESNNNNVDSKSDKSKRPDLFAVSEEMPPSLRGGLINQEERIPVRSSLTLVSEYLQNRSLRLRETDTTRATKKTEDLQSLKQTILRTRASKEGTMNACHVHDEEMVPVPSWHAEHSNCGFCPHRAGLHKDYEKSFTTANIMQLNKNFNTLRSRSACRHKSKTNYSSVGLAPSHGPYQKCNCSRPTHPELLPSPVLRGTSPFRRAKVTSGNFAGKNNIDRPFKSSTESSTTPKKSSIMMYNHATRNSKDIPYNDERLVIRNVDDVDDAYSQAMKESTSSQMDEKGYLKKVQEIRSKVAMTKQNVEKEYRDTISFLNAIPKDNGNKPIKNAYKDEQRQQMQKQIRQQKLQHEYRKIEKECNRHNCKHKAQLNSDSHAKRNDDVFERNDFQYSWMPVPEGDGNLAVHTIPTTLKEGKSGNTVKFSKIDSYHEYRSRHKHTPPTKETPPEKPRNTEAVVMQNLSDTDSATSDSSTESITLEKKNKPLDNKGLSEAEKIIVYKIIDKADNRKKTSKLMKELAKSLTMIEQKANQDQSKKPKSNPENVVSIEQLNEGVYKTVNENGLSYNIMSCYKTNIELWRGSTERKPWWDNIASMYYNENKGEGSQISADAVHHVHPCTCKKPLTQEKQQRLASSSQQWICDDKRMSPRVTSSSRTPRCNCGQKTVSVNENESEAQPSTGASTASFKTATNDKTGNSLPETNFIKLVDSGAVDAGKFYIGASGLLKNDAYEVVIQVRKKGDEKDIPNEKLHNKKQEDALGIDKASVAGATQTSLVDAESNGINTETVGTVSSVNELSQDRKQNELRDAVVSVEPNVFNEPSQTKPVEVDSSRVAVAVDSELNEPQVTEKGVSTENIGTSAQNIPKSCTTTAPKFSTSTYTQTSISSPHNRPVFFHMSSSTSTAYMSPPELIIPKLLKRDHSFNNHRINDLRNFDRNDIEFSEQHDYSDGHDGCRCKQCMRTKKHKLNKHINEPTHGCRHHTRHAASTPPNTVRSGQSAVFEQIYCDRKITDVPSQTSSKKSKHTCRKCSSHDRMHEGHNSLHHKKSWRSASVRHSSRNLVMRLASTATSCNSHMSKRSKTNLKPIIKKYIDRLLMLNEQTLKAVQIIDQDCSSVTTPGSSIIDVPDNISLNKPSLHSKLSLQQMQSLLKRKIKNDIEKIYYETVDTSDQNAEKSSKRQMNKQKLVKLPRKKTAHKVKSLNISKKLSNTCETRQPRVTKKKCVEKQVSPIPSRSKIRSKSSPTPRLTPKPDTTNRSVNSDSTNSRYKNHKTASQPTKSRYTNTNERQSGVRPISDLSNRGMISTTSDSERGPSSLKRGNAEIPMSISTQTSINTINVDTEINFIELAEDKLQNMEKIADLTEKCTKRLSNLAKVLEEVRKNKTLVYSQVSTSDTTSDSDQRSDKNINIIAASQAPFPEKSESKSPELAKIDIAKEENNSLCSNNYIPFLSNIPKPVNFKSINSDLELNSSSSSSKKSKSPSPIMEIVDQPHKNKGKPPPALSRIHLKNGQDYVVPHELSTVLEVDSPMSVKLKSSRTEVKLDVPATSNQTNGVTNEERTTSPLPDLNKGDTNSNPNVLDSNVELWKEQKLTTTKTLDNSKIQMIDLQQFNEIMLKPFFSLQEYAKQCDVGTLDDGPNLDEIPKDGQINDDMSSFHSEASLPDVISELLKRNIITEPFKFDTGSNANSTTVSSESTISVLALSKARQTKSKTGVVFRNKENIAETSDTLSISSNPDLENAFKKLGLGWASSTLKKTKEHLALSSSSNTSSSSLSQFRVRSFNQEIPVLVTDTVSSVQNVSKNPRRSAADNSKNTGQQTSLTNSMTVKEILTNELAKKITFNKSRNNTEDEFVTLFETKMPEEMKHSSLMVREENYSIDNSMRSNNNNRARTSTPVQLFKSMTYHSSSSSNISNGLFSNADDLSSVKVTSNSMKHSTSDKDDLIIPNFSLRIKRGSSECSKSD